MGCNGLGHYSTPDGESTIGKSPWPTARRGLSGGKGAGREGGFRAFSCERRGESRPFFGKCDKICSRPGFRIDKGGRRGYHNFNSLKQSNAQTRPVAPRRKPREKADGASLRERDGRTSPESSPAEPSVAVGRAGLPPLPGQRAPESGGN